MPSSPVRPQAGPTRSLVVVLLLVSTLVAFQPQHIARAWTLLVVAPFLEEAVFRAGLQEALLLKGVGRVASTLATATAFSAAHALLRADTHPAWFVAPALLIGAVYASGRRLRWCVALHALFNVVWLTGGGPATMSFVRTVLER